MSDAKRPDPFHPPDICGDTPNAEVEAGVKAGIEKIGLRDYVKRLAFDFRNEHWHDWRIYALVIKAVAIEYAKEDAP